MEVPATVLEKLKCENCEGYLSCAPVFLKDNKTSLCGRCTKPEEGATRNIPYEELAKLVKFPCKYQEKGCSKLVSFSECKQHEEACEFHSIICPVVSSGTCEWTGIYNDLLQHCEEKHKDLVVTNPVTLTHDISKYSVQTFIMLTFNCLFLIHAKVCLTMKTIYHSVRILGDPDLASSYMFQLDIANKDCNFNKRRDVAPPGCLALHEPTSMATSINNILGMLGEYRGTTFTLTIHPKCVQCNNVMDAMIFDDRGWKCRACTSIRRPCVNIDEGCEYEDIASKCEKHKLYFCRYTKFCQICARTVEGESLDQHYTQNHDDVMHNTSMIFTANLLNNRFARYIIKSDFGRVFFIQRRQTGMEILILIRSPLPSDQIPKYLCKIELSHPTTGLLITRTLEATNNEIDDWCALIYVDDLNLYIDNEQINVKIDFIKKLL